MAKAAGARSKAAAPPMPYPMSHAPALPRRAHPYDVALASGARSKAATPVGPPPKATAEQRAVAAGARSKAAAPPGPPPKATAEQRAKAAGARSKAAAPPGPPPRNTSAALGAREAAIQRMREIAQRASQQPRDLPPRDIGRKRKFPQDPERSIRARLGDWAGPQQFSIAV